MDSIGSPGLSCHMAPGVWTCSASIKRRARRRSTTDRDLLSGWLQGQRAGYRVEQSAAMHGRFIINMPGGKSYLLQFERQT